MDRKTYNYKNRRDGVWQAITLGRQEAQKLGVGESYQNWSPLMWYCYLVGIFGGVLFSIISNIILILWYFFFIK